MIQAQFAFDGIDQSNTPPGMTAILKSELTTHDNVCNHCDYRRLGCQQGGPTLIRCMPWSRPDGSSVLFKFKSNIEN